MPNNIVDTMYKDGTTYNIVDTGAERAANKVTAFQGTPDHTHFPSEKLVKDSLDAKEASSNKVAEWSQTPTDTHYPSEKLVKDTLDAMQQSMLSAVTIVVDTLPAIQSANAAANYILVDGDTGLLYRVVEGEWMLVGGSKVQVLSSLPVSGDTITDYYVPNASGVYIHYRWKDGENGGAGEFYAIGADAYSKSEVDTLLAAKEASSNKVTEWSQTPTDTHYPSEKLVKDTLDAIDVVTTVVVSALPAVGSANPDFDYILKKGSGALLYKVIDGVWKMVGGAMVSVVAELPVTGDSNTDYYVGSGTGVYLHYRWMDAYEDNGETVAAHFYAVGSDAYSKTQIDAKLAEIRGDHAADIDQVNESIAGLGRSVDTNASAIASLEGDQKEYSATLTQENGNYVFRLVENEETVVSQFNLPATGGGGGGQTTSTMTVTRVTQSPVIVTASDTVELIVDFSSVDGDNETVDGSYTLKLGSTVIMSGAMRQGRNTFDVTDYCSVGTQKFTLNITDDGGSADMKSWTVQVVDVRIESSFSDRSLNAVGRTVNFTYTPYGAISKTVHFKLDGVELSPVVTSASGILQSYTLQGQSHGAHLLECWITATVNGTAIETDHIYKDIVWYDSELDAPIIGCIYRYDHYGVVETRQYNTIAIPYYVYDPHTETSTVELKIDGVLVNTLHLSTASNVWSYKSDAVSVHILTITCRTTTVMLRVSVTELGYVITPITANLAFDFNPSGMSNNSANRLWEDSEHSAVKLSVSQNFDWQNGGYQTDEDGNQYFCVKSGTRAYISHNLFGIDPKQDGAEFKIVFKTTNVRDKDATFLTCLAADPLDKAGLKMQVHQADVYTSSDTLTTPYSEDDVIEFEYNINAIDTTDANATSFIMSYEDGVAARPVIYPSDVGYLLHQLTPVPITIGSDDCDVHIYRMKAYTSALSDSDILANFIADARDSDTMIARYERNQIYNENNELTSESVAAACPDLKIIKIDAPHFTNDKGDYVRYTNVECIHRNGDPVLDNWKFVNMYHAGQGTTSNRYGLAGRNIDLIGGFDGVHQVVSKISAADSTGYVTEVTLGDGTRYTGANAKIGLKRTSVPNNWFNIKVNIASSENANNALLQKRYNDFLPYQTPAQKRDPRIKNSMEFVNCVIFIKETDPDVTTHREFADNNWHFYAIGNIGDSKKTDNTRVNDPTDLAEFVVEISDNTLPNSTFDTGVYYNAQGNITYDPTEAVLNESLDIPSKIVYPVTQAQWNNANNLKRIALNDHWDDSFEFRYDMGTKDGETITSAEITAQQALSKQVFRDMYEWVVTSTDANFVAQFGNWFVAESPLYWYLFTERYTMTDNRSKNSFWHWGKVYITEAEAAELGDDAENYIVDDAKAAINNGYRFDLWNYDDDTALGIDNNGELNMTYGHEDIDFKTDGDPSSGYIFNAADSVFWRRIRTLMGSQLRTMYLSREALNCWSASSLIAEFDNWQEQFPEELWRLDIERKYLRPYYTGNTVAGIAPTADFLRNMMNGRKKYQRRQFERNQEVYIGTKYRGTHQCSDSEAISFRCNTPQSAIVRPNYTLRIVPYSDMYLSVAYGNSNPQQVRAKGGQEYVFTTSLTTMDDTQILVYCASNIQALNDLSACYIRANNFAYATRLKTLIIGSTVEGYSNPFITELSIGNNVLLEKLDIRNCPNLTGSLNLAACANLKELYAEGTALASVSFASNGKIEKAHLPASINSLTMRYLTNLSEFTMEGYANLISLTCEYCGFDPYTIVSQAINTLQILRLLGIAWTFSNTFVMNKIYAMSSSILAGEATITGPIRQSEVDNYQSKWRDLVLNYDPENVIPQYLVSYVNTNGELLYSYLADVGSTTIDPVAEGLIETPTVAPTDQYTYTYSGWDGMDIVNANMTVTARYTGTLRRYTIKWFAHNGDQTPLYTTTALYGAEAVYRGERPVDTDYEAIGTYKLFKGWDKSTGHITGDMNVYATFTSKQYPAEGVDLNELTATEIYAVSQMERSASRYALKDYKDIRLGTDFDFTNVQSELLLENTFFNGATYIKKNVKLFGADTPSWTLAIDYESLANAGGGANVLLSCIDTVNGDGLYLQNTSDPAIKWMETNVSNRISRTGVRNIVVLRYIKGSDRLLVYSFNDGANGANRYTADITMLTVNGPKAPETEATLIFGAIEVPQAGSSRYTSYGIGWVHWCKIWYDDLGVENCKRLANWPHENLRMEYVGSNRQYLSDNGFLFANASFMANHTTRQAFYSADVTSSDNSSWETAAWRTFCNERIFNALPEEWQSAIKRVKVKTFVNGTSSQVKTTDDRVYIPSYADITGDTSYLPEIESGIIPFYGSSGSGTLSSRVKFPGLIVEDRDNYQDGRKYYYQSNDPVSAGYLCSSGDVWKPTNGAARIYVSQAEGEKHMYLGNVSIDSYKDANGEGYWIPASDWCTRSRYRSSSSMIAYITDTGGTGGGSATTKPLEIGFSI